MTKTEKIAFGLLVFLLIVGLAAKFYKLEKETPGLHPNLKFISRSAIKKRIKLSPSEKKDKSPTPKILSLNSATVEDFEGLPYIGRATAEKIAAYRSAHGPFKEKTDLLRVDGITISRYKKIERFFSIP